MEEDKEPVNAHFSLALNMHISGWNSGFPVSLNPASYTDGGWNQSNQ